VQPKEKAAYLDGDWGEETQLTEQFLIQPGETLKVLKEKNGFFNCEWKGVYGWLRTTTVAFADPSVEGALATHTHTQHRYRCPSGYSGLATHPPAPLPMSPAPTTPQPSA
jgi:hypothetical protein